jgi:hypothetical protein
VLDSLRRLKGRYEDGEQRPLGGYLVTLSTYTGLVSALTALAKLTGRRPPVRVPLSDILVLGIATHRLSRTLAKDSVMSPLRAPFTRYEEPTGASELREDVTGESGVQHAFGELVSCPFCLGVWVATAFSAGIVFAPRLTRLVAGTFTVIAVSDFLQLAYDRAKRS